jgi:hypothetical protein
MRRFLTKRLLGVSVDVSLADRPRSEKGAHSMSLDPITQLEKTLEPHLVRSYFHNKQLDCLFQDLIAASRMILDRSGRRYRLNARMQDGISFSADAALKGIFGNDRGYRTMSLAKPSERPAWMSDDGYCKSIRESYRDTLATLLRRRIDPDADYEKKPLFRLVRSAVDIALKDRLEVALTFSDRFPAGLPQPIACDLVENVLTTLALGLNLAVGGFDGRGYDRQFYPELHLAPLAKTFTTSLPLGKTDDDKWIFVVA